MTPTNSTVPLSPDFVAPILDALDEQPPDVRDRLWQAIDSGDLTYAVLPDGRLRFSAGGEAFLIMECVGIFPVSPSDGNVH